jgi:hypothetical protein
LRRLRVVDCTSFIGGRVPVAAAVTVVVVGSAWAGDAGAVLPTSGLPPEEFNFVVALQRSVPLLRWKDEGIFMMGRF